MFLGIYIQKERVTNFTLDEFGNLYFIPDCSVVYDSRGIPMISESILMKEQGSHMFRDLFQNPVFKKKNGYALQVAGTNQDFFIGDLCRLLNSKDGVKKLESWEEISSYFGKKLSNEYVFDADMLLSMLVNKAQIDKNNKFSAEIEFGLVVIDEELSGELSNHTKAAWDSIGVSQFSEITEELAIFYNYFENYSKKELLEVGILNLDDNGIKLSLVHVSNQKFEVISRYKSDQLGLNYVRSEVFNICKIMVSDGGSVQLNALEVEVLESFSNEISHVIKDQFNNSRYYPIVKELSFRGKILEVYLDDGFIQELMTGYVDKVSRFLHQIGKDTSRVLCNGEIFELDSFITLVKRAVGEDKEIDVMTTNTANAVFSGGLKYYRSQYLGKSRFQQKSPCTFVLSYTGSENQLVEKVLVSQDEIIPSTRTLEVEMLVDEEIIVYATFHNGIREKFAVLSFTSESSKTISGNLVIEINNLFELDVNSNSKKVEYSQLSIQYLMDITEAPQSDEIKPESAGRRKVVVVPKKKSNPTITVKRRKVTISSKENKKENKVEIYMPINYQLSKL
jgi:hypothetical protein